MKEEIPKKIMWEYTTIRVEAYDTQYIDNMDLMGTHGWECYQIINHEKEKRWIHFFKRPYYKEKTAEEWLNRYEDKGHIIKAFKRKPSRGDTNTG